MNRSKQHFLGVLLIAIIHLFQHVLSENVVQTLLNRVKRWKRRTPSDSDSPSIIIHKDIITADEAQLLLQRYKPLLRDSLHRVSGRDARRSQYRTSRSLRLPPLGDALVFDIEQRAAALVGVTHNRVEDFQLACYQEHELYGLHRDDDPSIKARVATVLLYLQAPVSGGATLFTRRALEDEREKHNKQRPLQSEKAALELFHDYCKKPRKHHLVAEPVVGNAVVWWNWSNDTDTSTFVKTSTHGACPVGTGEKCVIQQWIAKQEQSLPLRDDRIAGIFPAGAELSYRTPVFANDDATLQHCQTDKSTNQGKFVTPLCLEVDNSAKGTMEVVANGPYENLGAWRRRVGTAVASEGWKTTLTLSPTNDDGMAVSFWSKGAMSPTIGTKWISIPAWDVEVVFQAHNSVQLKGLSAVSELKLPLDLTNEDWLWTSLSVGKEGDVELSITSRRGGQLLGNVRLERAVQQMVDPSCQANNGETAPIEIRVMWNDNPAHLQQEQHVDPIDLTFVVLHKAALQLDEASELRLQGGRYNVNS